MGLDPKQIIEIRELIRQLSKRHTVILSSHILAEVREVCDHILIISKGKLVASDTPENLERMLGDADTIEIETRAPRARIREVLKNVPGIEQITCEDGKDGVTSARIRQRRGEDVREDIFRAFAENKLTLLTLRAAHVSLEDVFMELTQNDTVPDAFARRKNETEQMDENARAKEESSVELTLEEDESREKMTSGGEEIEAASGAEWVETDGEGDETNAGDL